MDKSYLSAMCNKARAFAKERFDAWIRTHTPSDPPLFITMVVERKEKLHILESQADLQQHDIKHLVMHNTLILHMSENTQTIIRAKDAKKGVIYRLYGQYRKVRILETATEFRNPLVEVEPELKPKRLSYDTQLEILEKKEQFMRTADVKLAIVAKEQYGERDQRMPTLHIRHNTERATALCKNIKALPENTLLYEEFQYQLENGQQPFCMNCLKFFNSRKLLGQITLSTHPADEIAKLNKKKKRNK